MDINAYEGPGYDTDIDQESQKNSSRFALGYCSGGEIDMLTRWVKCRDFINDSLIADRFDVKFTKYEYEAVPFEENLNCLLMDMTGTVLMEEQVYCIVTLMNKANMHVEQVDEEVLVFQYPHLDEPVVTSLVTGMLRLLSYDLVYSKYITDLEDIMAALAPYDNLRHTNEYKLLNRMCELEDEYKIRNFFNFFMLNLPSILSVQMELDVIDDDEAVIAGKREHISSVHSVTGIMSLLTTPVYPTPMNKLRDNLHHQMSEHKRLQEAK